MNRSRKLPTTYYNWLTMTGAYVSSVSLMLILLFWAVNLIFDFAPNPYLGIVLFLVLPMILMLGLVLIPIGVIRTNRRIKRGEDTGRPPSLKIDFGKPSHRRAVQVVGFSSVILLFVGTIGGYQVYHYSESVAFCGTTCHEVMKPEHVAYQNSPHARVPCASCHIGGGASWWAKSKISGAYQVYAVLTNKYPTPIPTPIKNLRPAQETCEQCHWPEKYYGAQQKRYNHFKYDEQNTSWPIDLLLKTGGGDERSGQNFGIHWHMNVGNDVEYICRDEQRQEIAWVRVRERKSGRSLVYENTENPLTQEERDTLEVRTMDCMDCHNRPSHIYNSPDKAIDLALSVGRIDATLPNIKSISVEVMDKEYSTEPEAFDSIATGITNFYAVEYPEILASRQSDIEEAIATVQDVFSKNIFPEMKVRWDVYPNNLGHLTSPGCFRCHNENLVATTGQTMHTECTTCHSILSQGSGELAEMASSPEGLEFKHPEDIDEEWQETLCSECHSGIQP